MPQSGEENVTVVVDLFQKSLTSDSPSDLYKGLGLGKAGSGGVNSKKLFRKLIFTILRFFVLTLP